MTTPENTGPSAPETAAAPAPETSTVPTGRDESQRQTEETVRSISRLEEQS